MTHPLAEAGAQQAADHADRVSRGEWTAKAYDYLVAFGRSKLGAAFMAEDVRAAAEASGFPSPPDGRAWGSIILRAKREGHLIHRGYAPNKSDTCHGSPKSVWSWVA